jgi:hypothetical protein
MPANGVTHLVTVYNKAAYIEEVLKAIRRQQGDFARQCVIVDDGSTDGSGEIVARTIADWPEAELIRQPNGGPAAATNRGLERAAMPFIHIVDGDDILAPHATRVLLRAQAQSGCGLIYGQGSWYASPDEIRFPEEPSEITVEVLDDTLYTAIRRGIAGSSALLVSTEAFRRVGGCDPEIFVQDQSLPQRLATVTTIGTIDHLLCLGPRFEPGRVMTSLSAQVLHDQSLTALHTLRDNPHLPPRFRRLVQRQVTGRAWKWALRKEGDSVLSRAYWRFVLAHCPFVVMSDRTLELALEPYGRRQRIRRPGR